MKRGDRVLIIKTGELGELGTHWFSKWKAEPLWTVRLGDGNKLYKYTSQLRLVEEKTKT